MLKQNLEKNPGLNHNQSANTSWLLYGFLIVAFFSLGVGIISLVAANWRAIPAFIKLFAYFLVLSSVGFLALKFNAKKSLKSFMWFESLLIFFMILCLAGIGLISQIYNIRGESYQALFFWSFITSGLMIISRKSFTMYIWLIGLYMACIGWMLELLRESLYFKIVLLHPLIFLSCSMLFSNQRVVKTLPALAFKRRVLEEWTIFTGFISLAFFHVPFHQIGAETGISLFEIFLVFCLSLITFTTVFISAYKKIQKYLLSFMLFLFLLFYFLVFYIKLNSLVLMLFSSFMLMLSALFFATLKKINLFMFFVFALIIRILFFYITLFKSLTLTGLILVLMGTITLLTIQLVRKNKEKLMKWLEHLE